MAGRQGVGRLDGVAFYLGHRRPGHLFGGVALSRPDSTGLDRVHCLRPGGFVQYAEFIMNDLGKAITRLPDNQSRLMRSFQANPLYRGLSAGIEDLFFIASGTE